MGWVIKGAGRRGPPTLIDWRDALSGPPAPPPNLELGNGRLGQHTETGLKNRASDIDGRR